MRANGPPGGPSEGRPLRARVDARPDLREPVTRAGGGTFRHASGRSSTSTLTTECPARRTAGPPSTGSSVTCVVIAYKVSCAGVWIVSAGICGISFYCSTNGNTRHYVRHARRGNRYEHRGRPSGRRCAGLHRGVRAGADSGTHSCRTFSGQGARNAPRSPTVVGRAESAHLRRAVARRCGDTARRLGREHQTLAPRARVDWRRILALRRLRFFSDRASVALGDYTGPIDGFTLAEAARAEVRRACN
jgi:hypothetical protein